MCLSVLLLCCKSVIYRKRSQYSSQKPLCTKDRAWKAYVKASQTAALTLLSPGLTQLQLGWKHQHPYPFTQWAFLGFISQGMRASVFSTGLLRLEFLHLHLLSKKAAKKSAKQLKTLQTPLIFSPSRAFSIFSWSHIKSKNNCLKIITHTWF